MALTPIAERLAVELSLSLFNDIGLSRLGFEHTTFHLQCDCSKRPHRHGNYLNESLPMHVCSIFFIHKKYMCLKLQSLLETIGCIYFLRNFRITQEKQSAGGGGIHLWYLL